MTSTPALSVLRIRLRHEEQFELVVVLVLNRRRPRSVGSDSRQRHDVDADERFSYPFGEIGLLAFLDCHSEERAPRSGLRDVAAKGLEGDREGSGPPQWPVSKPSISRSSAADSSKSNTSMFSAIRLALVDFGITDRPFRRPQRRANGTSRPTGSTSTSTSQVPGHELSGVVVELGHGTTGLTVGQRVFGLAEWSRNGSLAEFTAVEARNLAPLPADVDHTVAAVVPTSGLTARQALFDHARLTTGQTVLIHGAAGGVGCVAAQLAREAGARVIGTGMGGGPRHRPSVGSACLVGPGDRTIGRRR